MSKKQKARSIIPEVNFVTQNKGKMASMRAALAPLGVQVKQVPINAPEIQSLSLEEISEFKARFAHNVIKKPVVVLDAAYFLEARNGFPGPFGRYALETLGIEGLLDLVFGKSRVCILGECVCFFDGQETRFFSDQIPGSLSNQASPESSRVSWSPLWRIFVPEGFNKTLSDMTDEEMSAWRKSRGDRASAKFGDWYVSDYLLRK